MQDGRIKVGDGIVAVGDEPVAGLSVKKVQTHPCAVKCVLFKVKLI